MNILEKKYKDAADAIALETDQRFFADLKKARAALPPRKKSLWRRLVAWWRSMVEYSLM